MPVDERVKIALTHHCYRRAAERFGPDARLGLMDKARASNRTGAQTHDGLRAYKHRPSGIVFLMLEKRAESMGGLYELEGITVITAAMLARTRVVPGSAP